MAPCMVFSKFVTSPPLRVKPRSRSMWPCRIRVALTSALLGVESYQPTFQELVVVRDFAGLFRLILLWANHSPVNSMILKRESMISGKRNIPCGPKTGGRCRRYRRTAPARPFARAPAFATVVCSSLLIAMASNLRAMASHNKDL